MHIRTRLFNLVLILGLLFGALGTVTQEASAASITDLFISEYIEGGSFNKVIEIFNGTGAPVDLTQYSLELYSNGASSPTASTALSGTLADGDVFIISHGSADASVLAIADATSSSVINFNGDDAIALRKGTAFIDVIGQIGVDPGASWGSGDVTTVNDTLVRKSSVCAGDTDGSDAFDPVPEWDGYAQDTFDYLGSHTCDCYLATVDPVINEFSANTVGTTDIEYLELYGEPETDYSNLAIVAIEGEGTNWGIIDGAFAMGTTDANGFYLLSLTNGDLENGSYTLLLVSNFTGAVTEDTDTDDDGVIDYAPWDEILDAVAVLDGYNAADLTYGEPVLEPYYDGLAYSPGGASRIPDGFDTDAASDWVRNDFDLAGIPGETGTIGMHEAYNTPGATNVAYEPPPEACGDEYTAIYAIQGDGAASPLIDTEVATEGIVVGDYQEGGKNGFFIQDADGDGDPTTSDGVWVYAPSAPDVMIGDHVRVRGTVTEYFDLTEIGSVSQVWICATEQTLPNAGILTLPMASADAFEPYEGMRVTFAQDLVISEYFNFDRYGEVVLTSTRHVTPTALYEPGSPEYTAAVAAYALDEITLDDGRTSQNPDPALHPDGAVFDMSHLFRGGSWVTNLTAVLDYNYGAYKLQPSEGGTYYDANPRLTSPLVVPGDLTIASFNVLNYFVTLTSEGNICGPSGDMECRGADTAEELTRQRAKIVAAMTTIDADVFGLMEIENDRLGGETDAAVFDLVNSLNAAAGAGTYDYIGTGAIGTDAIKVAIIYKPASVTPVGNVAILDSTVDPRFLDDYNRPALAVSFEDNLTGQRFTVVVNHLKSKGSSCDAVGDPDLDDGAGNCNITRSNAAAAEVDWLATDPTNAVTGNIILIGDFNSYDKEDPIDIIKAGADDVDDTGDDYLDMVDEIQGDTAYGYVYDAQVGYLDYALANVNMSNYIVDVNFWHINADEPDLIDYDMSYKQDAQDLLYEPDAYRSSDHDPVVITVTFPPFIEYLMPIFFH